MSRSGPSRTVGILGGMGPEATIDLMQRVLRMTPASGDEDHLRLLVDNNPRVPSRIAALIEGTGISPAPTLRAMAEGLVTQGAEFLAMPCNTAHHYHAEVATGLPVPFLNMVELTAGALAELPSPVTRVGLLASSALQKIELYEPALEARGMQVLYPSPVEQGRLMDLIKAVKADRATRADHGAFSAAALDLQQAGAEVLLIACTELSVISAVLDTDLPVYDSADILSQAIVAHAQNA